MIATKTDIEFANYLLNTRKFYYVLILRMTTDCVENVLSSVRAKHTIPNFLQFKKALKLIMISKSFT